MCVVPHLVHVSFCDFVILSIYRVLPGLWRASGKCRQPIASLAKASIRPGSAALIDCVHQPRLAPRPPRARSPPGSVDLPISVRHNLQLEAQHRSAVGPGQFSIYHTDSIDPVKRAVKDLGTLLRRGRLGVAQTRIRHACDNPRQRDPAGRPARSSDSVSGGIRKLIRGLVECDQFSNVDVTS